MPRVAVKLDVPITRSPRVNQVESMFDVPEAKRASVSFDFAMPIEDKDWSVGLIVGPSGAGKSTVARAMFQDALREGYDWSPDKAVVDDFAAELPTKEVVGALSSVGFASPPGWLKPYRVLSNGERFRVNLARALLDPAELVVIDEFTSVVDRTVARIGAHAVAKAIRARADKRFVAVTCHEDVLDWLQPDWVCEPATGTFSWRSVQRRPDIELKIVRAVPAAWRWFAPHHYLTGNVNKIARCFLGLVDGQLAAFGSTLPFPHPHVKQCRRLHRTVVLPDFQGVGIATALNDVIAGMWTTLGYRVIATAAHPALIKSRARSKNWTMTRSPKRMGSRHNEKSKRATSSTWMRRTASFRYVGPPHPDRGEATLMCS